MLLLLLLLEWEFFEAKDGLKAAEADFGAVMPLIYTPFNPELTPAFKLPPELAPPEFEAAGFEEAGPITIIFDAMLIVNEFINLVIFLFVIIYKKKNF